MCKDKKDVQPDIKPEKKVKHPGKENMKLDKIPDEKPENKWL